MTLDSAALGDLRAQFEADGYRLDVSEEAEGRVKALISVAREDACADCLVPPEVLSAIMGQMLGVPGEVIDITYPSEVS
ncbi:MAG: hypothetical protein FWC87_07445 [Acidimicrobiaceae bacterium]|nr:hypothetical protein [Acidimicrobiaceae bacterium]